MLDGDQSVHSLVFGSGLTPSFLVTAFDGVARNRSLTLHGADAITTNTGAGVAQTVSARVRLIGPATFNAATAGGSLVLAGTSGTNGNAFNALELNGRLTLTGPGNITLASPIRGDGSDNGLTKSGTGTLTLTGVNTYGGTTRVSGGTLLVSNVGALGAQGTVGLQWDNGVFGFTAGHNTITTDMAGDSMSSRGGGFTTNGTGNSLTISGTLNGMPNDGRQDGSLTLTGGGIIRLTGANTKRAPTFINDGTRVILGDATRAGSLGTGIVYNEGILDVSSGGNAGGVTISALSGGGNVTLGNNALTVGGMSNRDEDAAFSGVIGGDGRLIKAGTRTLTLTGVNTYGGTTTVSGGTLLVSNAAALGAQGIDGLVMSGGVFGFTEEGDYTIARDFTLAGTSTGFTVKGFWSQLTLSGTLSGSANLLVTGGRIILTAANTYTGGTTITAGGRVVVGNANVTRGSLGTGRITNNGVLAANNSYNLGNMTIDNIGDGALLQFNFRSDAGDSIINNKAEIHFNSISDAANATIINDVGGSVILNYRNSDMSIGSLSGAGYVEVGRLGFSGDLNLKLSLGGLNKDDLISGEIGGPGYLIKTGTGTLTLSGANTYRGTTTVSGGTLLASGVGALGAQGINGVVMSGGVFGFLSGSHTITRNFSLGGTANGFTTNGVGNALTLSGVLSGTGSLTLSGGGTVHLTSANTYGGGSTIIGGTTAYVNGTGRLGTGAVTLNGSTLGVAADNTAVLANDITLVGAGNRLTAAGVGSSLTLSGVLDGTEGGLTLEGSGTVHLTGANTYGGGTTLRSGTLAVASSTALGTGRVTLEGGTLIAGDGGPRTLSNAVTLNASTTLSSGAVATGDPDAPGLTLAGTFTLGEPARLSVTGASRVAITGVVQDDSAGVRTLIKDGAGTLVLTADNTYTGGTVVRAGKLVVNNAFGRTALGSGTGEGAVTVARGATLTGSYRITGAVQVNGGGILGVGNSIGHSSVGSLTLVGGSVLDWELGADGVSSDRLNIASLLSRTGTGGITFSFGGERLADGSVRGLSEGTFTLLTFGATGDLSVSDFFATGLGADWAHAFSLAAPVYGPGARPGALTVTLTRVGTSAAAPEPSALALLLGPAAVSGLSMTAMRRRRSA